MMFCRRPARLIGSVALLACAGVMPGCLQRTLRISSEPPGAVVWLNDVEVGTTPCEVDFTFYGGYDVRLRRDGYEPILEKRKIKAPPREWPVIDLAAEAIPANFHNRVEWHFVMTPVAERSDAAAAERGVLERAADLRSRVGPASR